MYLIIVRGPVKALLQSQIKGLSQDHRVLSEKFSVSQISERLEFEYNHQRVVHKLRKIILDFC